MSRAKLPEPAVAPIEHREKRSLKPWLAVLGVLVLVVAALGGTYAWTQSQYFVGRDGSEVAIFRGVNTEFGPLKFFTVYKNTTLQLGDLNPSVRTQVTEGITARSEKDAEKIVSNLRDQQLPICPTASPTPPTPTPSPSPRTAARTTAKVPVRSTPRISVRPATAARTTAARTTAQALPGRTTARPTTNPVATQTPTVAPDPTPSTPCRSD